jgi:flagellar biosynthesis protein FlhA
MGRMICSQYQSDRGELQAVQLAPALEERLLASVVRTDHGAVLAIDPADARNLATRLGRALETAVAQPVLVCSPALRPHLWRLLAKVLPHLGVLSHLEVPPQVKLAAVAVID